MRQLLFGFMRRKKGLDKYTEEEVASWLAAFDSGKSYRQVAAEFDANYSTVFWHIRKHRGVGSRRPGRKKIYVDMTNPERDRVIHLKKNYGLTSDDYDKLLEDQNGSCAICGRLPTGGATSTRNLHVDHDHKTGKIRGLLCQKCNPALGQFNDEPALLRAAAAYLEKSRG